VKYCRKNVINSFIMSGYFDLLQSTSNGLGLSDKPSQIWNVGETSFCFDPAKTKVVGAKNIPSRTTSGPGGQNTTVVAVLQAQKHRRDK
jgi:hypothetical protein